MFIKLTHYGTPTCFNIAHIVSFRLDIDPKGQEKTKIFLISGAHTFIDEGVKELHHLLNDVKFGKVLPDYDYEVPSIPERMESQYNREANNRPQQNDFDYRQRKRSYNNNNYRSNYNEPEYMRGGW